MAIIDLNTALSMADYGKNDRLARTGEAGITHHDLIFLPVINPHYAERLHNLNSSQCVKRLQILYDIMARHN